MDIQGILEKTLPGLGYELVNYELTSQGDLRVFIDKAEGGISLDDCVAVSNHLSRVLAVEDVDYQRLEISSPGLDRPLTKPADFARFAGQLAKIKTRLPIDGQKNFIGRINGIDDNGLISITLEEANEIRRAKRAAVAAGKTVCIEWQNVDKARLKPEFDF
ncbi:MULTISPECIES: ribosome maturation factor RimP [Snodgrassella]|uniref:Ribosome maturation factor RimP n=1 Tax=Snodgrassella alvi TaxID=1196083 RepID=A0A2N9X7B5_9NEIS|nr:MULTISPECIES: ribosome maturation factor RimP [Snodgrassella]MCX8747230.1 ribosome maturation factor RimP [Snodgrassella sp. B3800]MCX8748997.1 ribosome maturation factor RimP [Snodgrassella sp. B3088]MCX8752461.1 ribosome maturation factor RimP [Snodgrassella sp. B3837]PIT37165.1 ribosome maturation factor RimP [Snodgrassella alvi]PIT39617.1 ribosome maturation factor RimP [Snodgrassella alvi]